MPLNVGDRVRTPEGVEVRVTAVRLNEYKPGELVKLDLIEVKSPNGTEVCIDPEGDEAKAASTAGFRLGYQGNQP